MIRNNYNQILIEWNEKIEYILNDPWTLEKEITLVLINLHYSNYKKIEFDD